MSSPKARRRRPAAAVALVAVALFGTGGAYAVATAFASPASADTSEASPEQIKQGATLFKEGCSSCHGLNLEGVPADNPDGSTNSLNGPSLIGVGAAAVDFQVGTGRMPLAALYKQAPASKVSYNQEEIYALAAYVASFAPGPAIPSESDLDTSEADLAEGGELFRTNCAQCHNFAGQGGVLTNGKYAPTLDGVSPKHIWEAMITGPQNMPVFGDGTLDPDDKRAILKYIDNIKAQDNPGGSGLGRVGPVSEGLLIWTLGIGALIGVSVWIGAKSS